MATKMCLVNLSTIYLILFYIQHIQAHYIREEFVSDPIYRNRVEETLATYPRVKREVVQNEIIEARQSEAEVISKRDACEKYHLCQLHAKAGHSLFDTFELYFVKKENAKEWDHNARTSAECNKKYPECSGETVPQPAVKHQANFRDQQYYYDDY